MIGRLSLAFVLAACTPPTPRAADAELPQRDASAALDPAPLLGAHAEARISSPRPGSDGGAPPSACGIVEGGACASCGVLECIADWPTCHAEAPCLLFEEGTPIAWPRDTPADEWGSGVAIGHLDDDGRLDIVSGAPDGLWVSWGRGGGTSARLSHDERLAHVAAVTIIDADGDGLREILATTQPPNGGVHLLRRTEAAAEYFRDPSALRGVSVTSPGGPAWADYDGDGDLDVFVPCYLDEPSLLLRNDGGTFVDVAVEAGVSDPEAASLQAHWLDYDEDGDPDLFVANDKGVTTGIPSRLFRNDAGRFTDVTAALGLERLANAMGVAVGDLDGDLRLDLHVTTIGYLDGGQMLFLGREEGFEDAAAEWHAQATRWYGWGNLLIDYDNDGDLDAIVAGTQPREVWMAENVGGALVEIGEIASSLPEEGQVGLATADLDGDGRLDLVFWIWERGPRAGSVAMVRRFYNRHPSTGHWLRVQLRDRGPNAAAIGARVHLETTDGAQLRVLDAGGSFFSSSEPVLHFGLGARTHADRIEVTWPDGGVTRLAGPIPADQTLTIDRRP